MGKKRILGQDRAIMMLCHAARKYWHFYSPIYKQTKLDSHCNTCGKKVPFVEVDHNPPVGPRPRTFTEFSPWLERLFTLPHQGLCKAHHLEKTKEERKKRKDGK